MDYLQFANTTIYKIEGSDLDKKFGADVEGLYGEGIKAIYWAVQADAETGEIVAETQEVMLEYADGKFAYTLLWTVYEATLEEALSRMLKSMADA